MVVRLRTTVLVGALAGAFVAGCAGPAAPGPGLDRPAAGPDVGASWTSCAKEAPDPLSTSSDGNDARALPRLDDGFVPVAAVICGRTFARRPDGGEDMVAIESRADDVAALVDALRLPDQPPTDGPCRADLVIPPWLVLLDAQGHWVRPGVPYDACGKPRIEFRNAVDALALKRIASRPIKEVESAAAAKAGCSQDWADMVWVETTIGSADPAARLDSLPAGSAQVRLCGYRVPAGEQRSGKPRGDFAYGGPLSAGRWAAAERAIRAARPAKPCTTPASRFALLRPVAGGPETYVELTGCRRIMATSVSGKPALRQADDALIRLLGQSASRR
jgi:hypothetical protein